MTSRSITEAALDRAAAALDKQALSWINLEANLTYDQARILARLALEAAQEPEPETRTLTSAEVFAKAVEAFYATEKRFLASPNDETLVRYLVAQEHHYVLREHLGAVSRVKRAFEASQLVQFTEQLMEKLDARDAAKEVGDEQ